MGLRTWLGLRRPKNQCQNLTRELPSKPGKGDFRGNSFLGAYSYVNGTSRFYQTEIGRFCGIGTHVLIGGPEHPTDRISIHPFSYSSDEKFPGDRLYQGMKSETTSDAVVLPTVIGNDCWVGAHAYVKRGVRIGDGAVLGAHAVVTKDVPPYAIVVGTPARILRLRFSPEIIERLLELRWWDYVPDRQIVGRWDRPIDEVVTALESAQKDGCLRRLNPKVTTGH